MAHALYNIEIIETPKGAYLFSGNTGQIFGISDSIKDALQGIDTHRDELLTNLEQTYPDIFSPSKVSKFTWDHSERDMEALLSKELQQMSLGVTTQCNMRCSYCVYSGEFDGNRVHADGAMSRDIALKAADYFLTHIVPDDKPRFFTFYGGEPLLEFELIKEVINYINSKRRQTVYFSITTNGTLLSKDKLPFLIDNGVFIMVSLDGDKATHDKNRRYASGNPTYDVIMRSLEKIRDLNPVFYDRNVMFSVTLTAHCDYKELDAFFSPMGKLGKSSGVLSFGSRDVEPTKGTSKNMRYLKDKFIKGCKRHVFDSFDSSKPWLFAMQTVSSMIKLIHNRNVSSVRLHDGEMKLRAHCTPGATKLFVAPDGTFYPCEKVDSCSHLIIGSLDEGVSIERISAIIQPFIDLKNKKCKRCIMQDICNMCIHSASDGHGFNEEKFDLLCDYARSDFKASLEMYCSVLEDDEDGFDFILKESLTQRKEIVQ